MRSFLACFLSSLWLVAFLGAPSPSLAAERPLVILFGGYGSTQADMRLWEQAAAKHPRYGRAFAFEAIAYPKNVNSSVLKAVLAGTDTIERVAARIRAMPGRRVIVAGHSSGAALAISVVSRIADQATIKLVSLDAGINTDRPTPPEFYPIARLECWSVASGGLLSFGFRRARELCKERFFVLSASRCATPVCLHYALVNRHAPGDLTFPQSRRLGDGISGGYADLSVNLDWLEPSM